MLRLNVNEAKQLTFEVQIGGVQGENIESVFRIIFEDIEYGFPAKVGKESITVNLPPLTKVIGHKIKEGDEAEVKLQIVADGHHITPWADRAKLSNPLVIEAKIRDDNYVPNALPQTILVVSEDEGKQRTVVKEKEERDNDLTERIVNKLAEKFSGMFDKKEEVVEEYTPKVEKRQPVKETKERSIKKVETPSKLSPSDILNITEKGVYEYMTRAGTKNPNVQKIIYEQAETAAQSSRPVNVLRQVVKILKSKK